MSWHEHPLTIEQRTANWMWMSAVNFHSSQRDHTGHGEPPEQPSWPAIPGDQWFDLDTGRAWVWRDTGWSDEAVAANAVLNLNAMIDYMMKPGGAT